MSVTDDPDDLTFTMQVDPVTFTFDGPTAIGNPGPPGADSTVPGPPGLPGLRGEPGPPGEPGSDADATAAIAALSTVYVPQGALYGTWYLDSFTGTDDARMAAALSAWEASPVGGTITLAARTHTFANAWQPMATSMGAARYDQKYLRITGAGAGHNGVWTAPVGGTLCDMTYAGTAPGKIDTRGTGTIEIDHLSFRDLTGDTVPFFHTTNTTPKIHDCAFQGSKTAGWDQDAIICGGISNVIDGTDDAPFQGFGGFIRDCYFDQIRRGVYGRTYFNGFPIVNNTWSTRCGASSDAAAIELLGIPGAGLTSSGNTVRDNMIETANYVYCVKVDHAVNNTFGPNTFFHPTAGTLACYSFGDGGTYNTVIDGFRSGATLLILETPVSTQSNTVTTSLANQRSTLPQPYRFLGVAESPNGFFATDAGGNRVRVRVGGGTNPYPRAQISVNAATVVADAVTTSGSAVVTSATAAWTATEVGIAITGTGIPAGTYIQSRTSATSIVMTKPATITNTGVSVTFGRPQAGQDMTMFERHHIIATGTAPVPVASAAAGTGATVSLTGTDLAGTVTITTGTAPTTGLLCQWTAAINWTTTTVRYALTARNAAAASLLAAGMWITQPGSSVAQINTVTAPAVSTAHIFDYIAIQ